MRNFILLVAASLTMLTLVAATVWLMSGNDGGNGEWRAIPETMESATAVRAHQARRPDEAPGLRSEGKRIRRSPGALDAEARARLLAAIAGKLAGSFGESGTTPGDSAAKEPERVLTREYVEQCLSELAPLIEGCIDLARPELEGIDQGQMKIEFSIVAHEEYGGLVEDCRVLEDTDTLGSPTLTECFRETIYALRLKAPVDGGRVKISLPLIVKRIEE